MKAKITLAQGSPSTSFVGIEVIILGSIGPVSSGTYIFNECYNKQVSPGFLYFRALVNGSLVDEDVNIEMGSLEANWLATALSNSDYTSMTIELIP